MTKQEIIDKLQSENPTSIPIFKAMDEWARQQAIAFFKFCLPGGIDFEPYISKRYDQFIEQQNK